MINLKSRKWNKLVEQYKREQGINTPALHILNSFCAVNEYMWETACLRPQLNSEIKTWAVRSGKTNFALAGDYLSPGLLFSFWLQQH